MMKYDKDGNPADLEAAYRWIENAGYGYALDPIKVHIAALESKIEAATLEVKDENANLAPVQAGVGD